MLSRPIFFFRRTNSSHAAKGEMQASIKMWKGNKSFKAIFDAYQAPNLGNICRTNREQSKVCKISDMKSSNSEEKKRGQFADKRVGGGSWWVCGSNFTPSFWRKTAFFGVIGTKNREIWARLGRPRARPGLGSVERGRPEGKAEEKLREKCTKTEEKQDFRRRWECEGNRVGGKMRVWGRTEEKLRVWGEKLGKKDWGCEGKLREN